MDNEPGSVTSLLIEFTRGNKNVESELAELVYSELRRLATIYMRRERANHTLEPTALVHEIWARLKEDRNLDLHNRAHFYAIASHRMRQVLVDHARKRKAAKRGGAQHQVSLHDHLPGRQQRIVDVLTLNEVLNRLKALDPRASRIVEMHFFGGVSFEDMATVLDVSTRTVKRDWSMARAWLQGELANAPQ
jgi:RNA polymerase sigma factor (TIGR02999 family)